MSKSKACEQFTEINNKKIVIKLFLFIIKPNKILTL